MLDVSLERGSSQGVHEVREGCPIGKSLADVGGR
jgi:hypothetical protein